MYDLNKIHVIMLHTNILHTNYISYLQNILGENKVLKIFVAEDFYSQFKTKQCKC